MWRKCLAREFLPAEHPERSQRYNSTQAVILLDARERDEYDSDHIPGVVLSPVGTIDKDTAAEVLPEKGPTVLVYCRGGNRSKTISSTLAKLRYTNIYAFDRGKFYHNIRKRMSSWCIINFCCNSILF